PLERAIVCGDGEQFHVATKHKICGLFEIVRKSSRYLTVRNDENDFASIGRASLKCLRGFVNGIKQYTALRNRSGLHSRQSFRWWLGWVGRITLRTVSKGA